MDRDDIITAALRKLGVLPSGASPSTNQLNDGVSALNAILKAFQADGMPLWKIIAYNFTVTSGTSTYNIGPTQTLNTNKPLRVIQALRTPNSGVNVPMNIYTRYDFELLPNDATGDPVNIYYQPLETYGVIQLWPTPDNSTTSITISYQSPYEDMTGASDDLDFPSEWTQAVIYNLAWALAPEYGIPPIDRSMIQKEAQYWHDYALSMGTEEGGLFIQPDWTRG